MMDTKVTTVIVNDTKHDLTMKVGNRNCYARLASVKKGAEYKVQIDVNWTYQEFLLQDKGNQASQLFVNSDDCCDYERISVKEIKGKFDVQRDLRKQFRNGISSIEGIIEEFGRPDEMRRRMSDPDHHYCRDTPCSYCGRDWP